MPPHRCNRFSRELQRIQQITTRCSADEEIARIGPGTPGGEFMRRFWHPVFVTEDLGELPEAIKILGEELVVFRHGEKRDRFGLVHKYCAHRRASLEYGKCESNGIRCCYHGWLFAPDGEILETPAEDTNAPRGRVGQGAHEAWRISGDRVSRINLRLLGPPEKQPEFPVYDSCIYSGMTSSTYKAPYTCNWIQVLDAILDPTHTTYLHSQNSHPQFSDGMKEDGVLKFYERNENHFLGSSTRRIDKNAWVRVNELILAKFYPSRFGLRRRRYRTTILWAAPVSPVGLCRWMTKTRSFTRGQTLATAGTRISTTIRKATS